MIYTKFVTSNTIENATYRRALSDLRKMALKKSDTCYLVSGAVTGGTDAKILKQRGIITNSGKRTWIVEEDKKVEFFKWADANKNITLFDVCGDAIELNGGTNETTELKKDEQQDVSFPHTRSFAYEQAENPFAMKAVPNFDDYPYTKYEKARIIEARTLQITGGSPIFVERNGIIDAIEIAEMEVEQGVCPITVKRKSNPITDDRNRKLRELMRDIGGGVRSTVD